VALTAPVMVRQFSTLRENGRLLFAQGFHFARPMPPEDVALLLDVPAVRLLST
jgi:EAL domain-containing protein (putative c-di-GMP-specific phosphodiesterase class I)